MQQKYVLFLTITIISFVVIVALTAVLVPQQNEAFAAAVDFVNAAAKGNDEAAEQFMSEELKQYVADNCENGSVSACVAAYAGEDWGPFSSAVFRRSVPDDAKAWDILLVATYSDNQGFSGVCIYNRVEEIDAKWQVTGWAGFVPCDLPEAGLQSLANNADAPNKVP